MRSFRRIALALGFALPGATASADHFMATADPEVVYAINQIVGYYYGACQAGNQMGCQMAEMAQQEGYAMLNAGYDCMMYNYEEGCWYYNQSYQRLGMHLAQLQQAQQSGMIGGGGNPLGATHEERMTNIHNWGQSRLAWGQQQSQLMDQRHEQFMQTLRE
ncbi:hypothetical protein [Pelagovum pacificum]|uniref:Uncharacterized protein n=1 Tax=Pelagovum pacificum TaxID=2588711 RepID=A0A5C5GA95_9RHOB|nr:hypothetical protein [Pelagovum pacificum]QQA41677.1 hypothetical protein I8N54_12740 [Pelagovum pacificum]TNY30955.1 hypothetical protein FHY64_17810 [Pelagovum pacificum]